jgi:TonB family protein
MGYQALLFCPDEKLANVVTQVFNELDFSVEAVQEPFAAVKKLMAQHYDALVVDSANDQNASLLFKSARNSSFNSSSLAIALVEGQTGVAKAYRIGANLVLTKPINVEQAKGTLRVARGLLRKNSDTAASAGVAAAVSPAESPVLGKAAPREPATAASQSRSAQGQLTTPAALASAALSAEYAKTFPKEFAGEFPELDAMAGPKHRESVPLLSGSTAAPVAAVTAVEAQRATPPLRIQIADNQLVPRDVAASPAQKASTPLAGITATKSAAAPAPAREATPPSTATNRIVEAEPSVNNSPNAAVSSPASSVPGPSSAGSSSADAPSFAALGEPDPSGWGSSKKILIGAIVLALAALGYIVYSKFGASSAVAPVGQTQSVQPQSAPSDSSPPAPTPRPMSSPSPDQAPAKSSSTTLASQSPKAAPAASSGSANPGAGAGTAATRTAESTAANSETSGLKSNPAPIVVKSGRAGRNAQPKASDRASDGANGKDDESEPLLALSSANDSKLSGLMSSVSSAVPTPALSTLKISQGVSQGLLIKRVNPIYPKIALATHVEGAVLIDATINKDGNVTNTKVVSGAPVLAQAALEAVRQWRYKPYYLDGTPVDIETQIKVNFKAH